MLITRIGASCLQSHFPESFSNQLYYSSNVSLGNYTYKSAFSIKYVLSGYENYNVEGREFCIKPGQHLLVNNNSQVTTLPARGEALSIFIDPETIAEVRQLQTSSDVEYALSNVQAGQKNQTIIRENVYTLENENLHRRLGQLSRTLLSSEAKGYRDIDPEFFYDLSLALLQDQEKHSNRLHLLEGKKSSTIQEQYDRLIVGWQYLHDNWNRPFSLSLTASAACLSSYHFHRLFKNVFGLTPYLYHQKIQMEKAVVMLGDKHMSVSEIAYSLGFNSTSAFGRSFKKYHQKSPSFYRSCN